MKVSITCNFLEAVPMDWRSVIQLFQVLVKNVLQKAYSNSFIFLLWKCNKDFILTIFYHKVQKCVIKNALKIYIDVLVCWVNVLIIMTSHMTRRLADIKFSKFLLWTELIRADWGRWQQLMWQMQKETAVLTKGGFSNWTN